VQEPVNEVTYYHVELPQHDALIAEGLPVESYLGTGGRKKFGNAGLIFLHPDFASRAWEAAGCAPLIVTGPKLDAVRDWLDAISTNLRSVPAPARRRKRG
jgi:hypothetical protein